jgi:hypothetical protein
MVLSLDADLQDKLNQASSKPVWLVEVYPRPFKDTTDWSDANVNAYPIRFCYSDQPLVIPQTYTGSEDEGGPIRDQTLVPNIVQRITPLSSELGPIERDVTQEDISVEIIDEGTIRNILDDPGAQGVGLGGLSTPNPNMVNFLLGQKVVIKLGFQSLDTSKFLQLGVYAIEEVRPSEGSIEISCKSITSIPQAIKVTRNFRSRSPHGQIHELLFNEVGLDNASGTYDESSVDAWYTDQPSNDIGKRHWACRREENSVDGDFHSTATATKDENVWDLLATLSYQTGGFVIERENGKITYVPYVASASAVRDLAENDVDQFSQSVTYSNTKNRANLSMSSTVGKTEYEGTDRTGGTSKSGAYFGGIDADVIFSAEIKESAAAIRFPDRSISLPESENRRWMPYEEGLAWQSPISNAAFLEARLVTWGDMAPYAGSSPMTNAAGSTQGAASYDHATRRVTLDAGYLNVTSKPGTPLHTYWAGFMGFRLNDFVDVNRGPVFRVTSIGSGEPIYDASGNHISFKEGRIESIDNTGASSVITLADDFLLEFEDDWGSSVSGYSLNWVILEPSFPVSLDPSLPLPNYGTRYGSIISNSATLQAAPWTRTLRLSGVGNTGVNPLLPTGALGVRCLPDPSGSSNLTQFNANNPTGLFYSRNPCKFAVHFSRYFYIQWAGMSGFSGSNIQFAGNAGLVSTHNAPFLQNLNPRIMGGPARGGVGFTEGMPGGSGYTDLRPLYGHEAAAPYAQLQGYERTQKLAITNDKERYAYLKFEYQGTPPYQHEYVKCNAAYPIPASWVSGSYTISPAEYTSAYGQQGGAGAQRVGKTPEEPPIKLTPDPRQQTGARTKSEVTSTFVYRVDCKTQSIGFDMYDYSASAMSLASIPAFDGARMLGISNRVIVPSGRGQLGTIPTAMLKPENIANYAYTSNTPSNPDADFTATIDYLYEVKNTSPITVTLPPSASVTLGQRVGLMLNTQSQQRTGNTVTVESDGLDKIDGKTDDVELSSNGGTVFKWVGQSGPTASASLGWRQLELATPSAIESHYLGALASDVTVAKSVAERILNRAAEGMPIVEFTTSFRHLDLQIGDFISVTHPLYLRHGKNGSDTGTIFEITRKEIDIEEDTPRIGWSAAWVRQNSVKGWKYTRPAIGPKAPVPGFTTGKTPPVEVYTNEGQIIHDDRGIEIKQIIKYPGDGPTWPQSGDDYSYAGWDSDED